MHFVELSLLLVSFRRNKLSLLSGSNEATQLKSKKMSTLNNINTEAIEKLSASDAITFIKAIAAKFPKADKVFTNNIIQYKDKEFTKMMKIELTLQVFENKNESCFLAIYSRSIEKGCSNAVQFIQLCAEDFNAELMFQKKYNQIA